MGDREDNGPFPIRLLAVAVGPFALLGAHATIVSFVVQRRLLEELGLRLGRTLDPPQRDVGDSKGQGLQPPLPSRVHNSGLRALPQKNFWTWP